MTWLAKNRVALAIAAVVGLALLIETVIVPALDVFKQPDAGPQQETVEGKVTRVISEEVRSGPRGEETFRQLEVRIDHDQLVTVEQRFIELDAQVVKPKAGDEVVLAATQGPQGQTYIILDYVRRFPMLLLALAFCLLVVALGRWQGIAALAGIALSFAVILRFILPGILSGADPVFIAIIGSGTVITANLYLGHGLKEKTHVALAGTAVALILTAILAQVAIHVTQLTGLANEEAAVVRILSTGDVSATGLLLSGMIIGAIGVLDDVTIAQASAVYELSLADARLRGWRLYARAMNIGRDHIVATVNTLVLAYAGASLPLLVLLSVQTQPFSTLVNQEFLATEIVRTLVGSMGIVAAVPITTALAAWVAGRRRDAEPVSLAEEAY